MNETISVKEAAKKLGVTPIHLRMGIVKGVYPFGVAFKNESGRRTFKIYTKRMEKWLEGCSVKKRKRR